MNNETDGLNKKGSQIYFKEAKTEADFKIIEEIRYKVFVKEDKYPINTIKPNKQDYNVIGYKKNVVSGVILLDWHKLAEVMPVDLTITHKLDVFAANIIKAGIFFVINKNPSVSDLHFITDIFIKLLNHCCYINHVLHFTGHNR